MRPDMITQIIWKQFSGVTDVRAIEEKSLPNIFSAYLALTGSTIWRRPNHTEQFLPERRV